jgi:hypothetical protein
MEFLNLNHLHRLLHMMHAQGVNRRHLGRVFSFAQYKMTRYLLLVEMASRALKRVLRRMMRDVVLDVEGMTFDANAKYQIVEVLNLLFCRSKAGHISLWNVAALELHTHFGELERTTLSGEECFEELAGVPSCADSVFCKFQPHSVQRCRSG